MSFKNIHVVLLVFLLGSNGLLTSECRGQSRSQNQRSDVFSDSWVNYQTAGRKNFYFSETAITPVDNPYLTCMAGAGTEYVLGSRSSGIFFFSSTKKQFTSVKGAEHLAGGKITAIAIGPGKNEIWAGTLFSGLHHKGVDGRWENFGTRDGLYNNSITSILVTDQSVWVGTSSGVNGIVNSIVSRTAIKAPVFAMAYDNGSRRCYAGHSSSKLSVYDPSTSRWSTVSMGIKPLTTFNHLLVEPSGDILGGGFSGLFRISARNGQVTSLSPLPSQKLISCLTLGEDGVVYVGLLGKRLGIHSLEEGTFNNIFHGTGVFTQTNALARNSRREWIIVSFGRLWHFTDRFQKDGFLAPVRNLVSLPSASNSSVPSTKLALSYSSSNQGQGFNVNSLPAPPVNTSRTSFNTTRNNVNTSTNGINSSVTTGSFNSGEIFRKISVDGPVLSLCNTVSRVWAGTSSGKLYTITTTGEATLARSFNGPVTNLVYASSGRLYIVINSKDIYTFTGFSYKLAGSVPFRILSTGDASSDEGGGLWIGTEKGIYRLSEGKITPSAVSDTLPDKYITSIVIDGETMWVGTRLGLCQLVLGRWTIYSTADGLPSKSILSLDLLKGRLWVTTEDGVAVFNGRRFNVVNKLVANQMSISGSLVVIGGTEGITRFSNGRWSGIIPVPGGQLNSIVNTGAAIAVASELGLYIVDNSKL